MNKNNQEGVSHLISLAIVVVVAVIGFAGYFVYQTHKRNNMSNGLKAHAANYGAVIGSKPGHYTAMACQKPYASSKPDEVWVLIGKHNIDVDSTVLEVNLGNRGIYEGASYFWWGGSLQLYKLPVGRANINAGAYISGHYSTIDMRGRGGGPPAGEAQVFSGPYSLTSAYAGARVAYPSNPSWKFPLVKGLPVCNY